jgi:hypothetical protein
MSALQNVLKSKENWNEKLLEETILNVVSYLKQKDFKNVELKLLIPQQKDSSQRASLTLLNSDGEIDQALLKNLTKNSNAYQECVDAESAKILPLMVQLLKKTIQIHQSEFKSIPFINRYSVEIKQIYRNDWVNAINNMFYSINTEIEDRANTKIHIVYLIDSSLFKDIPFVNHIPFVNYIVF